VDPAAATRVHAFTQRHVDPRARRLLAACFALKQLWFVSRAHPQRISETVDQVEDQLAGAWR
jgi:hypothetical protein